jgi:ATP-dependent exoDNAse (exonuclease V) alpha subunit
MNFGRWTEEAKAHGFGPEAIENRRGRVGSAAGMEPGKTDEELIAEAMDKSVVMSEAKLARVVYADSVGRYGPEAAEARLAALRASLVTLERQKNGRTETRLTTQAVLDREARIVVNARGLADSRAHAIRGESVETAIAKVNAKLAKKSPGAAMTAEQVAMVRGATDARGLVLVQGHAGAGKTFTLKPVVDLYQDRGYQVVGTSTSGKAAQVLGRDAGIEADTIAKLKIRVEKGEVTLDDRTVLIVDEAGMVSSSDMDFLLGEARAGGAKVILVGDSEQLAPVDSGRPFEDLQREHGFLELSEVRRQKDEADREIGRAIREGRIGEAASLMKERGQWHAGGSIKDVRAQMTIDYADRRAAGNDALMVAAKRSDVAALNLAAREAMRERGLLRGRDVDVQTESGVKAFAGGDRVLFRVNDSVTGTKNGTIGEVEKIDRSRMVVRLADGERVTLRLDASERIAKATAAAEKLEKQIERLRKEAQDDWNGRHGRKVEYAITRLGSSVTNLIHKPSREEVKQRIEARKDQIERTRNYRAERKDEIRSLSERLTAARSEVRSLEAEVRVLGKIDHGHAITVHKSQGETVRDGDVLMLARGDAMESRQLAYVGATRNEGQAHVYLRAEDEKTVMEQFQTRQEKASVNDYTLKKDDAERQESPAGEQRQDVTVGREAADVAPQAPRARNDRDEGVRDDWRADEEQRWRERQRALEERAREGRERWDREQREHRERQSRLGSGRVLDPVEVALARARGSAEAADVNREAQEKMRTAAWINGLGGRPKGGNEARLAGITVDRESFEEASVGEARIEKEHAEARKSVQYALSREQSDREDGRNMDAIMMEVHRLKTSPDARERLRGEMLEEAQGAIDRQHASGDVGGARYSRSLLVETMREDRDRFEREREYADARNVIEAKETIERMRASPDPAVREAGEQARKQLGQSNLKQLAGDVTGARVDREKLVASLREQTPERAQKAGREVSEALPEGSPSPEVSKAATAKPAQPAQGRSDGPEMDHA